MNSPEIRRRMEEARRDEPLAKVLSHGSLAPVLAQSGQLRWRILLLGVLLGSIAVPLRTAFVQVAGEARVRGTVQDVVKDLLPSGALVSQQVAVGRNSVAIRLISTQEVPTAKLQAAEREIERRSGRRAEITVSSIASQSQLAGLMQRLTAPALPPPQPKPLTIAEMQQQLLQRVQPAVYAAWPPEAPLQSFDLQLSPSGAVVNAQYASRRELGKIPLAMIERQLQQKLQLPTLTLKAQRDRNSVKILQEARRRALLDQKKSVVSAATPRPESE